MHATNITEEVIVPKLNAKRVNFPWIDSREFTLTNIIFKEKGHIKTDVNLADKFNNICRFFMRDSSLPHGSMLDEASLKRSGSACLVLWR